MIIRDIDIWEKLYKAALGLYHPHYSSPFIYSHHVVCAIEAENGDVYTGFCIRSCGGVGNLCAERVAAINMFANSGQTKIKRIATFRDMPPLGYLSIPCGACREFLLQLSIDNRDTEIITEYESRKIITLGELMPMWWGLEKLNELNKY